MNYEQFKEFHDKHPNLDNMEYYAEFPETNKSTVRSWKSRASKPKVIVTPLPSQEEAKRFQGLEEEMVKLLCTQTNTNIKTLEGLDNKSALIVLRNKQKDLQLHPEPTPSRASNSPILPTPAPIGNSNRKFGIDPYINFDKVKNEIRMEIPWDVLFDPEKNRALGERNK